MISSYIKSAKRILFKDKFYTVLHVSGLAVGLATCFAIYSWVAFETSFDSHFESAENIYRVTTFSNDPSEGWYRFHVSDGKVENVDTIPGGVRKRATF